MNAGDERGRDALTALLVALVAFAPFLRGVARGASLYFRDLSLYFLPVRRFALEGLRAGEVRLWNPHVHEGVPLSLPALGYPVDLIPLVRPDEAFLSAILALHVPLAAVAFFVLARQLPVSRTAAAGGSLVYALGGFLLSTVNLYVHLQAAAWAPLLVLATSRVVAGGGRRTVGGAALLLAVALSTTGVEIVGQALLGGILLGAGRRAAGRGALRLAGTLVLGVAIAAPVLLLVSGQVAGSARGRGFPTDVVLSHSIHPFTLLQTLVGGLYGNLGNLANEWWGQNFFPRGFPYVLSLYLGATALALAGVGAWTGRPPARRLLVLAAFGLVLSLGRWAGLAPVVDALPFLHVFRFPVKAFWSVHLGTALLAALGLDALVGDASPRPWRRLVVAAGALGGLLVLAPLLPRLVPEATAAFAGRFFPPDFPPAVRAALLGRITGDAAVGGAVAVAAAAVGVLALRGRLAPPRAAALLVALVAADLLRTGAGLNPMVTAAFFRPSAGLEARLDSLREARVFTCSFEDSPAYLAGRLARPASHETWSFGLLLETLTPQFNLPLGVSTAMSPDLTMLVPADRVLSPVEASCRDLDAILPRLREAGVGRVLSVDPLRHPDLEPDGDIAGSRTAPLVVHVYRLKDPRPRAEMSGDGRILQARYGANEISMMVEADGPADLLLRDGWTRGWAARVDGTEVPIRPRGRHRSVAVPDGRHRVDMAYRPPGLRAALAVSGLALLVATLAAWGRRRTRRDAAAALLLFLPGLALPSPAGGEPQRPAGPSSAVESRMADIPAVAFRATGEKVSRPPLHRAVDLLERLWEGQGTFAGGGVGRGALHPAVTVLPVPWDAPDAAGLVTRSFGGAEESALSLVLWSGDAWCSPTLELAPRSRLRFEAVAIEGTAALRLDWRAESGTPWTKTLEASPPGELVLPSSDMALPEGRGRLCLGAEGGAVSVGEPRVLVPEPEGEDARPRWIVLAILDALRADTLDPTRADRVAPALARLAREGHHYLEAVSPGAHTQAAQWPLLTGRDLARVDPVRAGRFTPQGTPFPLLYSRANLAVSHLAQAAGYHTVFLGNNSFLVGAPLFARFSNRGKPDTGTVDTIEALPRVLERYADERVFLLYYVSTPHNYSFTPRRLFERFGCAARQGWERDRCVYDARVAHADEAIQALRDGLAHHGLDGRTFSLITADHGEVFGDARDVEIELYGKWWSLQEGHGAGTHWTELHVPLVVSGPDTRPARWPGRVSSLDIVPTLAAVGGFATPQRLDGRPLPLEGGPRTPPPRLVSVGYCSHSVLEGDRQLVWWEAECARRREPGTGEPITQRAEVWRGGRLETTDETDPGAVLPLVRAHLEWLAARLPGEAWIIDAARLGTAALRVSVPEGRIVDWGPSRSVTGLDAARAVLGEDGRRLRIAFRDDPGLFYFATWPPRAPVRFELEPGEGPPAPTLVGRLQLPLDLLGRIADPNENAGLWTAIRTPDRAPSRQRQLRVWRQPYREAPDTAAGRALTDLDRVLREWGYIR